MNPEDLAEEERIGEECAAAIRVQPTQIEFIEARGPLCPELHELLGGWVKYEQTTWRDFALKVLETFAPIMPICRWYPPGDARLELVACHSEHETKAFRLRPSRGPTTVFFVEYKREAPVGGYYSRPLFMVPMLDLDRFLRPPFDGHKDRLRSEQLRIGMQLRRAMPVMPEVYVAMAAHHSAISRGIWKVLSQDDSPQDDTSEDSP